MPAWTFLAQPVLKTHAAIAVRTVDVMIVNAVMSAKKI